MARKNLGKKHLLYFFECPDTPFTVLSDNRLVQWEDGFLEEYDLGKNAKAGGKNRFTSFERAMQVAQLEHGKPIEMRMDWNHQADSPKPKPKKRNSSVEDQPVEKKKAKPSTTNNEVSALPSQTQTTNTRRKNLDATLSAFSSQGNANEIESSEDGLLVCKILRKLSTTDSSATTEGLDLSTNLGFVTLPSRQLASFASIRKAIDSDLDDDMFPQDLKGCRKKWKFYVPKLGPVALKQEEKIGPVLEFLKSTTHDTRLGTGIASDPLKIVIVVV